MTKISSSRIVIGISLLLAMGIVVILASGYLNPDDQNTNISDTTTSTNSTASTTISDTTTSTNSTASTTTTITSTTTTNETSTLDFITCEGFLDEPPPNLVLKTSELTETAKKDNPNIVSMCLASYQTPDSSKSMALTVIKFDTVRSADTHFAVMFQDLEAVLGDQVYEGVIESKSYMAISNEGGVGSFVAFQKGRTIISMHTARPDGEDSLLNVDQLIDLAQSIEEKLP